MTDEKLYPLPDGWQWCRLGDVCKFIGGGTPNKNNSAYWNGNIPWASVKDIKGDYLFATIDKITEAGLKNSSANLCEKGDLILVTRIEPGKSIVAKIVSAVNQDLKIVKSSLPAKFLHYFFNAIQQEIESISSGSTVKGITLKKLENFPIPLPPPDEQQRIVDLLDELFTDLNEAKALAQGVVDGSELRRAAILHKAFSGELTKLWRDEHGISLDSRQKKFLSDVLISLKQKINDFSASGLKYVGLENMEKNGGRISFQASNEVKSTKNIFHAGDLLYGKLRPYLDKHGVAKFDGVCSTDILVFKARKQVETAFINYFLSLPKFIEYVVANSKGINLPRVSEKIVLNAEIILPPLEEQKEIVRLLDDLLGREQRTKDLARKTLEHIELMKKSILAKAFRGKLTIFA